MAPSGNPTTTQGTHLESLSRSATCLTLAPFTQHDYQSNITHPRVIGWSTRQFGATLREGFEERKKKTINMGMYEKKEGGKK